jgi:hypothetical protein
VGCRAHSRRRQPEPGWRVSDSPRPKQNKAAVRDGVDDASASAHDRAENRNADRHLQTTLKDARQSASFTTVEALLLTRVVTEGLRQTHRTVRPTPAAIQEAQRAPAAECEARRGAKGASPVLPTRAPSQGVDYASASAATERALRTR